MNKIKLTIIHTTPATVTAIKDGIIELYGDAFEIVNVMDDSLLNEIKKTDTISSSVMERFIQYTIIAENNQSKAILLACSSIGQAGDTARSILHIPLFKIDEPMADAAAEGKRILVLGTVKSTLKPTSQLIRRKLKNEEQQMDVKLLPNVFELYADDRQKHDMAIAQAVHENESYYDTIVLAQASMSGAVRYLTDVKARVLTSLPMGLKQLNVLLEENQNGN